MKKNNYRSDINGMDEQILHGIGVSSEITIGTAHVIQSGLGQLPEYTIVDMPELIEPPAQSDICQEGVEVVPKNCSRVLGKLSMDVSGGEHLDGGHPGQTGQEKEQGPGVTRTLHLLLLPVKVYN